MRHLDSKVRKYDGFAQGRRVFGRAPEFPVGAEAGPRFKDFTNPNHSHVTQTRDVLVKLRGIQMESLEIYFVWKLDLTLR